MNPRFSVIIPTYNQAQFLQKAIQSVIDQTYKDWEMIIVDNYSTDNTHEIVSSFNNSNIQYLKINNMGIIAKSRNRGIVESKGRYIAFLDSDDYWYPNKLEVINNYLNTENSFICHSEKWIYLNDDSKSKIVHYGPKRMANYFSLLFNGNCISTSAVVVLRSSLFEVGLFNESKNLITSEDYDLWLKLSNAGIKMSFLKDVLGEYLLHMQSNSNSSEKNMNAILCCFESHFENKKYKGLFYKLLRCRRISSIHYIGARGLYKNNILPKSFKLHLKSIFIWPFHLKTYISLFQLIIKLLSPTFVF